MTTTVSKDLAALEKMTIGELHDRYAELFGERIQSRHRIYLVRRIAWRIQANAEGGLSERARVRAAQLANPTDVRRTPPKWATLGEAPKDAKKVALAATADPRLPPAGAAIVRDYRGRMVRVVVLADGFEFEGERYRSLSAIAKAVTGSHINGFRFFNLEGRRRAEAPRTESTPPLRLRNVAARSTPESRARRGSSRSSTPSTLSVRRRRRTSPASGTRDGRRFPIDTTTADSPAATSIGPASRA